MKTLFLLLLPIIALSLNVCADPDGNVILVYHLKHSKAVGETKFVPPSFYTISGTEVTARPAGFQYYHIIRYNPSKDVFDKEYVIKFEKNKTKGFIYQRNALTVTYSTFLKVPPDGGDASTLKYLLGTTFQAEGRDKNEGNVCGKMIRANIPLSEKIDVGGPEKYYLPKEMTGRIIQQTTDGWQLFALYGRLNETYTDYINQNNLTLDQAFDYLSDKLEKSGYGPKITPQPIDTSKQITFDEL